MDSEIFFLIFLNLEGIKMKKPKYVIKKINPKPFKIYTKTDMKFTFKRGWAYTFKNKGKYSFMIVVHYTTVSEIFHIIKRQVILKSKRDLETGQLIHSSRYYLITLYDYKTRNFEDAENFVYKKIKMMKKR